MSFRRFRRQQAFSPTSSTSHSPTTPAIDTPITLHALASRMVPDVSLRRNRKQKRPAAMPSIFLEEQEDEDIAVPNVVRVLSAEAKTENAARNRVEEAQACKSKTEYYTDIFDPRGPQHPSRSVITHESIVVVEIKTNIGVKEEQSKLVSDLSFRMAQIYQRPESSMLVTIQQDACLHFGNSSLPAYLMKVFANPYLIGPVTNIRNTTFLQKSIQEFLEIAPDRGVIMYVPVPEENLATNGTTVMGQMATMEGDAQTESSGIFKSISRTMSRRMKLNSANSAPLSITTTTTTGPQGAGAHETISTSDRDGHAKGPSEDTQTQSVRKSRSLRDIVSRRVGDRGSQDETQ